MSIPSNINVIYARFDIIDYMRYHIMSHVLSFAYRGKILPDLHFNMNRKNILCTQNIRGSTVQVNTFPVSDHALLFIKAVTFRKIIVMGFLPVIIFFKIILQCREYCELCKCRLPQKGNASYINKLSNINGTYLLTCDRGSGFDVTNGLPRPLMRRTRESISHFIGNSRYPENKSIRFDRTLEARVRNG